MIQANTLNSLTAVSVSDSTGPLPHHPDFGCGGFISEVKNTKIENTATTNITTPINAQKNPIFFSVLLFTYSGFDHG